MSNTISLEELQELALDAAQVLKPSLSILTDERHPGRGLPAVTFTWWNSNPAGGMEEAMVFIDADNDLYQVAFMDDEGEIEIWHGYTSPRNAIAAAVGRLAHWEMLRRMEGPDAPDPDAPDPMTVIREVCR